MFVRIIITIFLNALIIQCDIRANQRGSLNSKRPLHHHQLLLQRQKLLRHQEGRHCATTPSTAQIAHDYDRKSGNVTTTAGALAGGMLAAGALTGDALNNNIHRSLTSTSDVSFTDSNDLDGVPMRDMVPCISFEGRHEEVMKYRSKETSTIYPNREFTISLRVKPEGGQSPTTTILALQDNCSPSLIQTGWSLGIKVLDTENHSQATWYFRLATDRSQKGTTIYAKTPYKAGQWNDLTATYDGQKEMTLYVDGIKVANSDQQKGDLFHPFTRECKELIIGGELEKSKFRGKVTDLRIWSRVLNQSNIHNNVAQVSYVHLINDQHLVLHERFASSIHWDPLDARQPSLISCDFGPTKRKRHHIPPLKTPQCGQTICDDKKVIKSYAKHRNLRATKNLRYKIINVWNDDGTNPIVTEDQIRLQHQAVRHAFRPYNISWRLDVLDIRNTSLRQKTILFDCHPSKIGNGECNRECRHQRTGYDGGDCDEVETDCTEDQKGNGICDENCNRHYHNWDDGDCCSPDVTNTTLTCFNPQSLYKSYMSLDEYKLQLNVQSVSHLNIFFGTFTAEWFIGVATFPWQKNVFSILGGTAVEQEHFGNSGFINTLVHEMGHNLGLWHVHRGVTEATDCGDPCYEHQASMELGDLCSDTAPTPQNNDCQDPSSRDLVYYNGHSGDLDLMTCGKTDYRNTPFRNYMSYAEDSCMDEFTDQQVARMHCYADLVYQTWQTRTGPSPVPLAPRIVNSTSTSLTLTWLPPLGSGVKSLNHLCPLCDNINGALTQYGYLAQSDAAGDDIMWGTVEATGPPDATPCKVGDRSWIPETQRCEELCFVEVQFEHTVMAESLSIWVPWTSEGYLYDIQVIFQDGTNHSLGKANVQCDMPYTTQLNFNKPLNKVRIYSDSPYIAIDAVQVISHHRNILCSDCPHLKYQIIRHPPFNNIMMSEINSEEESISRRSSRLNVHHWPEVTETEYIDRDVTDGVEYSYSIKAMLGRKSAHASPKLKFRFSDGFCGDGIFDKLSEECDDGNIADNDGCSTLCKIEESYNCYGSPSLCYIHVNDGICEDFEKSHKHIVQDCGLETPKGFYDQWPYNVSTESPGSAPFCPISVLTGPPEKSIVCGSTVDYTHAWSPCDFDQEKGHFQVLFKYEKAVVVTSVLVYFASDGQSQYDTDKKWFRVKLIDQVNGEHVWHSVGDKYYANCKTNPSIVDVVQDLSKPFYLTKGVVIEFSSPYIGLAAVGLRSSMALDPIRITSCGTQQYPRDRHLLYNSMTGRCMSCNDLDRVHCQELFIKHAEVNCTGNTEGDICRVNCNPGYEYSSVDTTLQCIAGVWTGSFPVCNPVDCGFPNLPHARVDCPQGTSYGSICKHECRSPAVMIGQDNRIECTSNGLWSLSASYCRVMCLNPPAVKNATLVSSNCRGRNYPVGTKCRIRCQRGYFVQGYNAKKRAMRHRCSSEGQWTGPVCIKVKCPPISPLYHGLSSCTNHLYAGSVCTLKCPDKQRLTSDIRCMSNGDWDSDFLECDFSNLPGCPPLRMSDSLQYGCENYEIGTSCYPSCGDPLHLTVLRIPSRSDLVPEGQRSDESTEELSEDNRRNRQQRKTLEQQSTIEVVNEITCTGVSNWFPAPEDLECIEECSQRFIGDGYCDRRNNRAFCDWDGGDCCESTVLGGIVKPFPETCIEDCQCEDPNAEENLLDSESRRRREERRQRREVTNNKSSTIQT